MMRPDQWILHEELPIIAGPDPVYDIEALVFEIYDYIYTGRIRGQQVSELR